MKTTKKEVISILEKITSMKVLAEETQAIVDFTVDSYKENPRNVDQEDIKATLEQIKKATGKNIFEIAGVQPQLAVENSKKVIKKTTKKTEEKTDDSKEEKTEESKTEVKKTEKKKDKESPLQVEKVVEKVIFPNELTSESLEGAKLKRLEVTSIADVVKLFDEEKDFVVAMYWNKKDLKKFSDSYDPLGINPKRPTSFENDLDLIEVTYASNLVVTGCSIYSEVPMVFLPKYFETDEDGMLYANGVEMSVYEVLEPTEPTKEEPKEEKKEAEPKEEVVENKTKTTKKTEVKAEPKTEKPKATKKADKKPAKKK